MWAGIGLAAEPVTKAVAAVAKGVMIGGGADCGWTWAKRPELLRDGANSANCLVNSPGGQPGTSISSATPVKSRSWNGK